MMRVPLLDLSAQHEPLQEEFAEVFARVSGSGRFILGPEVEGLEEELAAGLGLEHGMWGAGVSSGTDALLVALMALGVGPGDEVLCPSFTFFATAGSVARLGAKPVFVEVCPVCFQIDVCDAAGKVSADTKAIIPVHLFGQAADMGGVLELAVQHDLAVLEDLAQSYGAAWKGRKVGSFYEDGAGRAVKHLAATSFYPTKNLGALGEGGMIFGKDEALLESVRAIRNHGMKQRYHHERIGGNFRLDALQAGLLRVKFRHYQEWVEERRRLARSYEAALCALPGVEVAREEHCGCAIEEVRKHEASDGLHVVLPLEYPHVDAVWNQYTIRVLGGKRDALRQALGAAGVDTEIYYPKGLHQQECFRDLPVMHLPVTEKLTEEVLSLPLYPGLPEGAAAYVAKVVGGFLEG